jgi:hypothetical protein
MLNTLILKTYAAANSPSTVSGGVVPKNSDIIVLATPSTPIPAVSLKQKKRSTVDKTAVSSSPHRLSRYGA